MQDPINEGLLQQIPVQVGAPPAVLALRLWCLHAAAVRSGGRSRQC